MKINICCNNKVEEFNGGHKKLEKLLFEKLKQVSNRIVAVRIRKIFAWVPFPKYSNKGWYDYETTIVCNDGVWSKHYLLHHMSVTINNKVVDEFSDIIIENEVPFTIEKMEEIDKR